MEGSSISHGSSFHYIPPFLSHCIKTWKKKGQESCVLNNNSDFATKWGVTCGGGTLFLLEDATDLVFPTFSEKCSSLALGPAGNLYYFCCIYLVSDLNTHSALWRTSFLSLNQAVQAHAKKTEKVCLLAFNQFQECTHLCSPAYVVYASSDAYPQFACHIGKHPCKLRTVCSKSEAKCISIFLWRCPCKSSL